MKGINGGWDGMPHEHGLVDAGMTASLMSTRVHGKVAWSQNWSRYWMERLQLTSAPNSYRLTNEFVKALDQF